jgi:hypothetical protein
MSLVEQKPLTLHEHMRSFIVLVGFVMLNMFVCSGVEIIASLFVVFFWPLYCLSFFRLTASDMGCVVMVSICLFLRLWDWWEILKMSQQCGIFVIVFHFVTAQCKLVFSMFLLGAIVWFWVLIKGSNKLQCYIVMNAIKRFWYLIRVERLLETVTVYILQMTPWKTVITTLETIFLNKLAIVLCFLCRVNAIYERCR